MQQKSTTFIGFLSCLAVSLAGLAAGCGDKPSRKDSAPEELLDRVTIKVACPDALAQQIVASFGRGWSTREGAKIDVVPYGDSGEVDKADFADIVVCKPPQFPSWASKDKLLPVPKTFLQDQRHNWSDLLPLFRDKLLVWNRIAYGFALLGEAPLCFYRRDLLEDSAHQQAFQRMHHHALTPPTTWEQFQEISEYFSSNWHPEQTIPALPPLLGNDDDLESEFYAVAASYARHAFDQETQNTEIQAEVFSFHYDLRTGKPRITGPGFVHALKLLQDLQRFRPSTSPSNPAEAFQTGKSVLCLAEAFWTPRFQKSESVKDKFGICVVPGANFYFDYQSGAKKDSPKGNRVPYLGAKGYVAAVLKNTKHADGAFALLGELSSRETSLQIVMDPQWGGGVTRGEHFRTPTSWYGFGLNADRTVGLMNAVRTTLTHPGVKNPVLRLRTPDEAEHSRILVKQLRAALLENKDAAACLSEAAREWEILDKKRPPEEVRRDYLLSLGLQP